MAKTALDHERLDLDLLSRVAEQLSDPNGTTSLHVSDGLQERIYLFVPGGVRVLTRGDGSQDRLIHFLVSQCFVDMELLQELRDQAKQRNTPLTELALEKEITTRSDLQELTRKVVRDEVFGLVFWNVGYAIVADEAPREIYSTQRQVFATKFERRELSAELMSWLAKWPRIRDSIGNETTRIVPTELAFEAHREGVGDLDEGVTDVLEWCTEEMSLEEIWRDSGHHLPDLCDELLTLAKGGFITLQLPSSSSTDLRKDLDRQIERMEETIDHLLNPELGRQRLLDCYWASGQTHKIVHGLHVAADGFASRGLMDEAMERWKQIVEIEAENLDAHEKLFRALIEAGEEKKAVAHASAFATRCLTEKAVGEARFLAGLLSSTSMGALEARRIEAFALEASDKHQEAAEALLDLAGEFVTLGKSNRALQFAETALKFDPSSSSAAEMVRSLKASSIGGPGVGGSFRSLATAATTGGSLVVTRVEDIPELSAESTEATGPSVARLQPDGSGHVSANPSVTKKSRSGKWLAAAVVIAAAIGAFFGVWSLSDDRDAEAQSELDDEAVFVSSGDSNRVSRVIDDRRIAEWTPSGSFELVSRWSGELVARLEGREGGNWSVGFRAKRVCQWKAGEPATVFSPRKKESKTLTWKLPEDTSAVAVGEGGLAIRRGQKTYLYSFDGKPREGRPTFAWTEGLFVEGLLMVQGPSEAAADDALTIHAIEPSSMTVLWTGRCEDGAFAFP